MKLNSTIRSFHKLSRFIRFIRQCAVPALGIAALAISSCGTPRRQESPTVSDNDYTDEVMARVDSIVNGMSDAELVGQLFMPAVYATADAATLDILTRYACELHIGGIVLLRGDTLGAKVIGDTLRHLSPAPGMWIAIDAETGLGMRLKDAETMPTAATMGLSADGQRMYDYGQKLADQSRRLGINMILGPVLDVETSTEGFIGNRSFGPNPETVGELGTSMARGIEDGGVISVAKHFPGHGNAKADTHRQLGVIDSPLSEIERTALPPFREYISNGLSAVMVGHLAVPAIDPQLRSAALSEAVITDLLRGDLSFKGLVITDALNMKGAIGESGGAATVEAIRAGADIVIAPTDTRQEIKAVTEAMANGTLSRSRVKESVRRILFYKYRFVSI